MTTIVAFLLSSFIILLSNVVRESVELPQKKCEEIPEQTCPVCGSRHLIKNGSVHNGKSKHQCKSCGYQFVDNPTKTTVSSETKQLIDRLLLEREVF
jgi:transposase-like protein